MVNGWSCFIYGRDYDWCRKKRSPLVSSASFVFYHCLAEAFCDIDVVTSASRATHRRQGSLQMFCQWSVAPHRKHRSPLMEPDDLMIFWEFDGLIKGGKGFSALKYSGSSQVTLPSLMWPGSGKHWSRELKEQCQRNTLASQPKTEQRDSPLPVDQLKKSETKESRQMMTSSQQS